MVNSGAVKLGIITKAKTQPCTDCGQSFQPSAMEFDHLPEFVKMFELGRWKFHSVEAVLMEMAKCEVVCANCHRARTAARQAIKTAAAKERKPVHAPRRMGRPNYKRLLAADWLRLYFQDQQAHRIAIVREKAIKDGISQETLDRAGTLIGVKAFRSGPFWYWKLNSHAAPNLFEEEELK